ncbi:hypothetical protein QTP86_010199 [Hemibagrus guttatus]|nr:hypothetical protein QTP86_010199 [Hemibagrus guttatus]
MAVVVNPGLDRSAQENWLGSVLPGRNSQGFEEEEMEVVSETEQNSKSSRSCEETLAYSPQAKNCPAFIYESTTRDKPHSAPCKQVGGDSRSSCNSGTPDPLTPRKTRVLPAWMMAAAPAALNTSPAKASAKRAPVRTAARNTPSSKPSEGPKRPRARLPSSSGDEEEEKGVEEDEDEEEGNSKAPRKRARRLESDTEESQDKTPASKSSPESPHEDEDTTAAKAAQKTDKQEKNKESKKADTSQRSRAGASTLKPESSGNSRINVQQEATVQRRTPCPYGTSCYRKNPIHFQECSHPGDDDYEEEQNNADDEDDDRPECPYGTDCYRKNPLHKKEYKHTKPPAKKTAPVNDDDEDEDQYENSFINDGSEDEDVDEDSDYVPQSEDSEKEDIKRLQKEAKAFLQRKK